MLLSGADIIIKTLIEQECDVVFGYPGGQVIDIYESLYKYSDEINHILTAHEQGAAHAADGYARATGKVGVVIATSGPGATNLVTGIATAHLDSVPMIAITGNVETSQIGYDSFQEIDITGITLPITKHNYFVSDINELHDTIREAFFLAMSGRPGPVLIDVSKDVQVAMCEYTPLGKVIPDEKESAKEKRIEEAAKYINSSQRPFVYFGGGLLSSNAGEELKELCRKIDAPMGCSFMGLSAIESDYPGFLGMQGMHGHFASSAAMDNADCIIALGVRFNDRVIGKRSKFLQTAKIVHVDIDGSEISKTVEAAYRLRGDIKETLKKLLPLLDEAKHSKWQTEVESFKKEEKNSEDVREGMTPKNLINIINENIKATTPVVTDVGQHQMWVAQYLKISSPRRFISSGGLGSMGFGMGAAIGAQLATKEHTVLVTGDGGFGMNLTELATAVSNNIPVVIIVFNNGVLGMVRQWQTLFYDKHYSATVLERKTDFVEVAKAFGATGEKVDNLVDFEKSLKKALEINGPYVIDCTIDKDEFVLPAVPPGGNFNDIIVKVGKN